MNLGLGQLDPAAQCFVLGEKIKHETIGTIDVSWVARQRNPTKRSFAFAKHWPDVGGNESLESECFGQSILQRLLANVIAIIKDDGSLTLQREHCVDMLDDALP